MSQPLRQRRGGPSSSATSTIDLSVEEETGTTGGLPPIFATMEDFDTLRREATKLERHLEDRVSRYQQVRTLYVYRLLPYYCRRSDPVSRLGTRLRLLGIVPVVSCIFSLLILGDNLTFSHLSAHMPTIPLFLHLLQSCVHVNLFIHVCSTDPYSWHKN